MFAILGLALPVMAEQDDGQWTMPAKSYQATRFSGLDQINAENAKGLKVAWTFSTGVSRGHEAAPLVAGDMMYVVTPFPNFVYALDLKNNGALKWKYEPQPLSAAQGVACCDVVNRGCVFSKGRIFFNTLDNHCIAIDAASGKEAWKTKLGDINQGESITMAPLVVHDKVLVGNSGGEFGVRGKLSALDASSGKILWQAFSTGSDADCMIGSEFKPFYSSERGKNLGVTSWPPNRWQIGGGTTWGWITYDPDLNLIYYGTSNPGVWNAELRPGDNKWTCGVFARNPDTGQARWFYQFNPHDLWDHDGVNENIVLDLPINGSVTANQSPNPVASAVSSGQESDALRTVRATIAASAGASGTGDTLTTRVKQRRPRRPQAAGCAKSSFPLSGTVTFTSSIVPAAKCYRQRHSFGSPVRKAWI